MIRLYITNKLLKNEEIELIDSDSHYLQKVMRKKSGDAILLFNGLDGEWESEITSCNKNTVIVKVLKQTRSQNKPNKLSLLFAPIKNPDASWIVTKATELGVTRIIPILTKRTIVNKVNIAKLEVAAKEAAEQSNRLSVPEILNITPLNKAILEHDGSIILMDESGAGASPKLKLSAINSENPVIIVGPEGGFAADELNFIRSQKSCLSITLGDRILRAETAVIAALSLYQGFLGDWQ